MRTGSLIARLTDAFTARPEDAADTAPPAQTAAGLNILLAEDNEINALIATKHLERLGAKVVRAHDGEEALALTLDALNGKRPAFDTLLLDIRMPGLDGTEVARRVRDAEREAGHMPVHMIALTANAFDEDRLACLAAGMDEFLTKPVDIARLAQVLTKKSNRENLPEARKG